jgi:hypothetical protein
MKSLAILCVLFTIYVIVTAVYLFKCRLKP